MAITAPKHEKYGYLTVVSFAYVKNRMSFWNCVCVCGNQTIRCTGDLNRSKNAACRKCSQRNNKSKSLEHSSWKRHWDSYVIGALTRDYSFELTLEQFKEICSLNCHYCNAEPKKFNRYRRIDGGKISKISDFTAERAWIKVNGIDRKSNDVGYTIDNCAPCCSTCNKMKGTMEYEKFIEQCRIIGGMKNDY